MYKLIDKIIKKKNLNYLNYLTLSVPLRHYDLATVSYFTLRVKYLIKNKIIPTIGQLLMSGLFIMKLLLKFFAFSGIY